MEVENEWEVYSTWQPKLKKCMCQWHACRLLSLLKTIFIASSSLGEHYAAPLLWLVLSISFNTAILFSDVPTRSFPGSPTHLSCSPALCSTPPTPWSFDMADWKFLCKMCFLLFFCIKKGNFHQNGFFFFLNGKWSQNETYLARWFILVGHTKQISWFWSISH